MPSTDWSPPANWQSRPVCVLGGGVLGRRIAACFVGAGHHVRVRDPSEKSRDDAVTYVKENITSFTALSHKKPGSCEAEQDLAKAVKDCWLVFEAVPEILPLKEDTFKDLETYAPDDCLFGSNSSSYKSRELLGKVKDETKARVLNTHFMMPPEAIIVELMTSGSTYPAVFPFLVDRFKDAGLHPMVALKESSGFIFNRIWAAIKREVLSVLAEGVSTPEVIDSIWTEQYGSRAGPCVMMDQVGLDTVEHIEEHYIKERSLPTYHLDWLKDHYISDGKLGKKSDKGGLYAPPAPGKSTQIFLLQTGLDEPILGKSLPDFMHSGQILSWNLDDKHSRPVELIGGLPIPDGIDIAESDKRMYWTNMGVPPKNDGSVWSAKLDGSDIKTVVPSGQVHTPKQLHIDQEANKLYFCDREGLRVMRCNLDGSDLEAIIQTGDWQKEEEMKQDGTYWPVGITVSKKLNKFFWTQKGGAKANTGRIFAASIDMPQGATAANRADIEVVMSDLPECIDLEFDDDTGILYWTDRGELPFGNTVNKKQIIGASAADEGPLGRQIIGQGLGEGIGLRLDKSTGFLYVADLSGHVWKVSTKGGLKEKVFEGATHSYTGLALLKV
ncbi:hypothetical protein K431DRAFT_303837 [Polychaeton citri CBS 116435]|uniref:3-hydroxyacyl-CoA dehydrogenase n=1 Tax=Polychaeton citri CBS 116435 TaxID=1314669 RepID=A0A9P4QAB4_9PEZI|nr:hypothetical protein K431DRAFT_303837 [Polychaeton citri CBS 116435]